VDLPKSRSRSRPSIIERDTWKKYAHLGKRALQGKAGVECAKLLKPEVMKFIRVVHRKWIGVSGYFTSEVIDIRGKRVW
jgi:hypothetical protein